MSEIKDINKMLPYELEMARKLIEDLLQIKNKDRLTNLEYINRNKEINCPIDGNHRIKKNGHKNKSQRYWCYECSKSFTITNKSIVKSSTINYQQLKEILKGVYDYKPLNEIAQDVGISKTSLFELEIRIFNALEQFSTNNKLKGTVQVDEMYVRVSFKGTKKEKMPRRSKYSGNSKLTIGLANDQICVIVAVDSYDNTLIKIAGTGQATTEMISKTLKDNIEKESIIMDLCQVFRHIFLDNIMLKLN